LEINCSSSPVLDSHSDLSSFHSFSAASNRLNSSAAAAVLMSRLAQTPPRRYLGGMGKFGILLNLRQAVKAGREPVFR
jgi:hypothetical protein